MRTIKSKVLSLLAVLCSGMAFAAQVDNGVRTVIVPEGGSTKVVSLSSEAGVWTAESAAEGVATITPATSPSRDVVTNTITAVGAVGTCTTCTVSNASAKWTYNVRIDNHTNVKRGTANFVREMTTIVMDKQFPAVTGGANWISWSDDPEMATVVLQDLDKPDDDPAAGLNGAVNVLAIVKQTRQKAGKTTVYVENDKNNDLYAIDVTVQTISDVSVPLRHCEDESDPRGFYTVTEILPADGATTDNPDSWGYDYAYSTDESIAKIRIVDGKFEIYNPVGEDGRDGNARVFFIKNKTDVMENDAKIWIFDVSASTVEIEKYLTFKADKKAAETNATLNIRTHYFHNVKEVYTNKVLFVGTGCSSHSLERSTIVESIQAIQEKADVDVYLYRGDGNNSGFKGTFTKGGTKFADSDIGLTLAGNMHGCLTKFYNLFYDIAMNEDTRYKYDYIVMEFDGQRLGSHDDNDNYQPDENRDKVVAEWLNEYYEGSKDSETARVIWIVDDQAVSSGTYPITIHYQESNRVEGVDYFFRPYQANISGSGSDSQDNETHGLNDVRFRGLIGLLNPWTYLNHDLYRYSGTALTAILDEVCPKVHYIIGNNVDKFVHTGETYIHQAYYNNKDNLVDYLKNHITDTTYGAAISDDVETQGLQFVEGTLKMFGSYDKKAVTGGDPSSNSNWKAMNKVGTSYVAAGLDPTGTVLVAANHSITGHLDNIVREYWNLIQVDLVDADGSFRAGAKYDETLGKFVRDPNLNTNELDHTQGKAAYAYFYDTMWPDRGVEDEGETLWDWEFDCHKTAATATGCEYFYNGKSTNLVVSVKDIDVTPPQEVSAADYELWFCTDYTGTADAEDWKDLGTWSKTNPTFVNVTDVTVWCKAVSKNMAYFDAPVVSGKIVIKHRTVTATARDGEKVYGEEDPKSFGYDYDLNGSGATPDDGTGIVEGQAGTISNNFNKVSKYVREKGEDVVGSPYIISNGVASATNGNYIVNYVNGEFTIVPAPIPAFNEGATPSGKCYAAAKGETKVYNKKPSSITVSTKLLKTTDPDPTLTYSLNGTSGWQAENFVFTDVVEQVVWCHVDAGSNYYPTNVYATIKITPKDVTVTPDTKPVCEGEEPTVGYKAVGFVDDEDKGLLIGSYTRESGTAVGKYKISVDTPFSAGNNYKVTSATETKDYYAEIKECSCVDLTCVYVYRVKLAGKTVKGRSINGKKECGDTLCWAKPASFRVAGYIYGAGDETGSACEPCSCNDWSDDATTAMCHYWDENKRQVFADETTFSFDLFEVLRNGGARNKVQVFWTLGGLKLAGLGAFNPVTMRLKNASGFFAGALAAPTCSNWNAATCTEDDPTVAHVFKPCTLEEEPSAGAVTYGRWSMTYKADKVHQAEKNDNWDGLYPTGWQPKAE